MSDSGGTGGRTAQQLRAAYLFMGLIAFQVLYGIVTRTQIDLGVLGILVGFLATALGIAGASGLVTLSRRGKEPHDDA